MYDQLIGLPNYYTTGYFWLTSLTLLAGLAVLFYGQAFGWRNILGDILEDVQHRLRGKRSCQCSFHKYNRSLRGN